MIPPGFPSRISGVLPGAAGPLGCHWAVLSLPCVLKNGSRIKRLRGSLECSPSCKRADVAAHGWSNTRLPDKFPCASTLCRGIFPNEGPQWKHGPVSSFQLVAARAADYPDAEVSAQVSKLPDVPVEVIARMWCRTLCGPLRTVEA